MEEKVREQLLAPFPKNVVQDPPKGKFGKFVNHAVYVERLRDCKVKYSWKFEPTIIDGEIIGGIGIIQIEGLGTFYGSGDVEKSALQRATKGECMKLAESDAFKRACMRFGLGVELWSGTDDFFVDDSPVKKAAPKKKVNTKARTKEEAKILNDSAEKFAEDIGAKKSSVADQLNLILKEMIPNEDKMQEIKAQVYKNLTDNTEVAEDVSNWTNDDMNKFLNAVEVVLEDEDIVDVVIGSTVKEEKVKDIKGGAWEQEPPTENQMPHFNRAVAKSTDNGDLDLVKKAKQALADGKITKGNIFDWIDTESWSLKDGS